MTCGVCGDTFHNGGLVTIRDFKGARRRVYVCPYCAAFIRSRYARWERAPGAGAATPQ